MINNDGLKMASLSLRTLAEPLVWIFLSSVEKNLSDCLSPLILFNHLLFLLLSLVSL